jgi:hypothetical protein
MGAVTRRPRDRERGQATVEFAVVLPFFILLVIGLIEFGLTFNSWLNLSDVASSGARRAAVGNIPDNATPTGNEIKTYIKNNILTGELRGEVEGPHGYIKLCIPTATAHVGDPVTVKIGVDPYPVFKMTRLKLMDVNLRGTSTMRLEQAPPGTAPSNGWDTPVTDPAGIC